MGGPGPLLEHLWPVLSHSWGLCGRSSAAIEASVDGLGLLSGPMWEVLDRSRGLSGRSWAALGASVGGLGPLSGPMWAVLAAIGAYVVRLGSDQGEKWPKPERETDLQGVGPVEACRSLHKLA